MCACRLVAYTVVALALGVRVASADPLKGTTYPIDLPTALRLAGAQNLDIQIAREALKETEANRISAIEQFFPWLAPGISYHRRDGLAQAVPAGTITNTHYDSYQPGVTITAQAALGDAIYNALAAQQLVRASDQALEAQSQDSLLGAAQEYFDLTKAAALVEVDRQALETSKLYQQQLHEAVSIGIAFKGDELRVQTQTELYQIALRQAEEAQRVSAARLAQTLHLNPVIELVPQDDGVAPITLFDPDTAIDALVERALSARPELKQSQALVAAARDATNGALYGPLIPSVGAQVFAGGLGGGPDGGPMNFGASEDYLAGLSWRIGPGGLFDYGRIGARRARLRISQLAMTKIKDAITAEVVESITRVQSMSNQLALARGNVSTANETLQLTRERKQFGVGIVLEDLQAQQALNRARADYFTLIADLDKAQFALEKAVGGPLASP